MNNILYLIIILLPIISYFYSRFVYTKYKSIKKDISSFEIARKILDDNNLNDIHIVKVATMLPSHYDTRRNVVRLSDDIYDNDDLTSITVSCHECFHAVHYKNSKLYNDILSFFFQLIDLISKVCYPLLFISMLVKDNVFFELSVTLIFSIILYQLLAHYNEFIASKKAKEYLNKKYKNNINEINNILFITNFVFLTLPIKYLIDYTNLIIKKIKG